jgi:hypothetical protein
VHEFSSQHRIACHLPREQLIAMEPVIQVTANADPSIEHAF